LAHPVYRLLLATDVCISSFTPNPERTAPCPADPVEYWVGVEARILLALFAVHRSPVYIQMPLHAASRSVVSNYWLS